MKSNEAHDPNLVDAVVALSSAGITFWLNEGTLLGLVRDGQLIDGDDDIDISIRDTDSSLPEIANTLADAGFSVSLNWLRRPGRPGLKLTRPGGRMLDISSYQLVEYGGERFWSRQWFTTDATPPTGLMPRGRFFILRLLHRGVLAAQWSQTGQAKHTSRFSLALSALHQTLSSRWGFGDTFGYFIPDSLLKNIAPVDCGGLPCPLPVEAEKVLEHLYGHSWRTPQSSAHWTQYFVDAPRSLIGD